MSNSSWPIASTHDDVLLPFIANEWGLGEWRADGRGNYSKVDQSQLTRLRQFGVDLTMLSRQGNKLWCVPREELLTTLGEALKKRYSLVFGSVFSRHMMDEFGQTNRPDLEPLDVFGQRRMYLSLGAYFLRSADQIRLRRDCTFNVLLALEGANFVTNLGVLKELIMWQVMLFGIQYNRDNALATNTGGLTDLGTQAVRLILESHRGVDLAHSSRKTRTDILNLAESLGLGYLVCYTHGSTYEDVPDDLREKFKASERFITMSEIERIIRLGGFVGLGVSRPFFSDLTGFANRLAAIKRIDPGLEHVTLGCDFGGVSNHMLLGFNSADNLELLWQSCEIAGITRVEFIRLTEENAWWWVGKLLK